MVPSVKPFDFTKIKKLSSRHVAIGEALLRFYPSLSAGGDFLPQLTQSFERDLALPLKVEFVGFEETASAEFIAALPQNTVTVALKIQPGDQQALVGIDFSFCRFLVERVLGQAGTLEDPLQALSSMEEGVLEFLLAKALSQLQDAPSFQGPAAFRIAKIAQQPKLLADTPLAANACVFKFYLSCSGQGGYLQAYLPHPLLEGVFLREDSWTEPQDDKLEARLGRVSHIKTSLWAEIGRVSLMASEQAQLEKGDVILFDESLAAMGPQGFSGKTVLRAGDMPSEGLLAEVIDTEGKMVVKILDFFGGE